MIRRARFQHSKIACAIATLCAAIPQGVMAAETQGEQKASKALEVIQVTAQKRVQSLQDVPASISTIDGGKLEDNGISQMEEMSAYVPNFTVSKSGQGYNIYMRGLGSGPNQGFEQTVGTYVDGIYRGRAVLMRSAMLDVEMVEVLRGPQGTLFGMNTTAGALNLTTRNATDYFEAGLKGSYSPTFDDHDIEGFISGPVTEQLRARMAMKYENDGGYLENVVTGDNEPARESIAGRLTFDWAINDTLNANLKIQHDEDDISGRPLVTSVEPSLVNANSPLLGQLVEYQLDDQVANTSPQLGERQFEKSSADHVTLNVQYELSGHDLVAVTGWQSYQLDGAKDQDSTARPLIYSPSFNESYDQFSQELRLVSNGDNDLDYIVGAYYQTSELSYDERSRVYPLAMTGIRDYRSESDLWAVFGQLDYQLTDKLSTTLGIRYTREDKQGRKTMTVVDPTTGTPLSQMPLVAPPALAAALKQFGLPGVPGPAYAAMLGDNFPYLDPLLLGSNTQNIPNSLFGTIESHDLNAKRSESSVTPSFNLSYELGEDMVYFTAARGFKSGGFDARSNLAGNFEFDEEEVTSFEVGSKMSLLDGEAELNIALFSMNFEDLQTSVFDGQVGFVVENAGEATTRGIEVDGRWALTEDVMLFGSLGWLDFNWDDFRGAKCFTSTAITSDNIEANQKTCDLTGETNNLVPKLSSSLGLEHNASVMDSYLLRTTMDVNYRSEYYTSADLNPFTKQSAYAKVNLRVALMSDEGWEVAVIGKNLTDETISTFSFDAPFNKGAYHHMVDPGRSFTLQFKYDFD